MNFFLDNNCISLWFWFRLFIDNFNFFFMRSILFLIIFKFLLRFGFLFIVHLNYLQFFLTSTLFWCFLLSFISFSFIYFLFLFNFIFLDLTNFIFPFFNFFIKFRSLTFLVLRVFGFFIRLHPWDLNHYCLRLPSFTNIFLKNFIILAQNNITLLFQILSSSINTDIINKLFESHYYVIFELLRMENTIES